MTSTSSELSALQRAEDAPGGSAVAQNPKEVGRWGPVLELPNVPIHSHVLPNGKLLFWGRRDRPTDSLDVHECTPHILDPNTGETTITPQPTLSDGTKINLFCSGHAVLPDGTLLVAGGHLADGDGLNQAALYDYRTNTWTALPVMNKGRWYPAVLVLADGTAVVCSGSENNVPNEVSQIWDGKQWRSLTPFQGLPLYPRLHVAPDTRVFMSGWLAQSYFLNTAGVGTWTQLAGPGGSRSAGLRDYAPAVMYDIGKIIYIGGGSDTNTHIPTAAAEIIDVTVAAPAWQPTSNMHFRRRQHNATLLPDGTVLVTGGTRGGGGPNAGFNDLTSGAPVHKAELWHPKTGKWTELAAEDVDRCYHSIAVLLPDATVLSGGGGEYRPDNKKENDPKDSHRTAQIFYPPYLFQGDRRPDIRAGPEAVTYGERFSVGTSNSHDIELVSWIRLPSVTHANDYNQRINFLNFTTQHDSIEIVAPNQANICPPGHYMLFLVNKAGIPSVAKIIRIGGPVAPASATGLEPPIAGEEQAAAEHRMSTAELDRAIVGGASGTRVTVGLTSKCPYGIGACWGGAYEGLQNLVDVAAVRPIPNAEDSTAEVYLHGDTLPDLDSWPDQIADTANGSYHFRGVEVTVRATLRRQGANLELHSPAFDLPVKLMPFDESRNIQWDIRTGARKPAVTAELEAYEKLSAEHERMGDRERPVRVTGPVTKAETGWALYVRDFDIATREK
jgi:galactose oxidase